ncbi:putative zinc-binding oxidoreductase [Cladobotryum mycophilum]|uniref:Zinc-binding oxidoreductase n=1 Tax=Cladobotryum mycophilum TaxID=491253 RepID=A0ABR0S8Q1_9HYPO
MATNKLPNTMKVVHQVDPKTSQLRLDKSSLPTPSGSDEHLIQVKATSPCLGELAWEVNFPDLFPKDRERVPCTECAGIVVSSPDSNGPFKPGDEVFFRLHARAPGCLREYTIANTSQIALKPKSLGWIEAAATPLSSLTAYQGLFHHGLLDKKALSGDREALDKNAKLRVLITGAGGGVGSWATQLAAAAGAGAIIAVCGPSKAEDVRKAGATEIVDYTKGSIQDWVGEEDESRLCDMALDCVGGSSLAGCWSAVKENGILLSVAESPDSQKPVSLDKKLAKSTWFLMDTSGSDLTEIANVIEAGKASPWIDSVLEFEEFDEAFKKVESGKPKGKVVIKVAC